MTIGSYQLYNGQLNEDLLHRGWIRMVNASKGEGYYSDFSLLYTNSPSHILITAAKRHGHIVIDGLLYPLSPDTVYAIRPGQRVEVNYSLDEEQILYRFYFEILLSMSGEEEANLNIALLEVEEGNVLSSVRLNALCEKIYDHWHSQDPAGRFASQAGFQDILHLLFKKQGEHKDGLEQARQYMKHNYREEITVDRLSEVAGMNRYHFMRSFKERFNQSAMDYLAELRTNQAKRLMEEGHTLRDVAEEVGYKDPFYFSSQFKKHVGLSPTIYMANRKCRVAAYSWPNIGQLLPLQIIPYAAPMDQAWTDDYRKKYRFDIKVPLSHDFDFNRKALIKARPDYIIALEEVIPDEEKDKLLPIAPVLFLPWLEATWRTHLQLTAQFLDKAKEGERWLSRYDEKAEAVREKIPDPFRQGTLLIVNISVHGIKVWGRRAGTVLYDDLKLNCAQGVEEIEFTQYIEVEQLGEFNADVLLINVLKDRQSQLNWRLLQQLEAWQELKAVRNQNIYLTSGQTWFEEPILEYTAYQHYRFLQELHLLFSAQ